MNRLNPELMAVQLQLHRLVTVLDDDASQLIGLAWPPDDG